MTNVHSVWTALVTVANVARVTRTVNVVSGSRQRRDS